MARSVQSVAQNRRQISSAASSAAAAANQVERSIEAVASLAGRADTLTRRVATDAQEGGSAVERSIQGIGRLREAMTQSSSVMKEMGKRTGDISSIVTTINMIAERTNLLSLNALIEAARAGDAGRGFAVVAEEIRNLADRSAKATADIASIIKALQDVAQDAIAASNDGLRVADDSNTLAESGAAGLRKILSGVNESVELVAQIARATEEQRTAGKSVAQSVASTADQAKLVADATTQQATAAGQIVQGTSQIRKVAQEVTKAVTEQGRASRDIMKAAQATAKLAAEVRKATAEQTKTTDQMMQVGESVRRGSVATSRAVQEQAVAADQISKAANHLTRQIAAVDRAVGEQAQAAKELSTGVDGMRVQSDQAARAASEQARTMKEIAKAAELSSREIRAVAGGNKQQSKGAAKLVAQLADIRRVTQRNADGVGKTRGSTVDLLKQAQALTGLMNGGKSKPTNGRPKR